MLDFGWRKNLQDSRSPGNGSAISGVVGYGRWWDGKKRSLRLIYRTLKVYVKLKKKKSLKIISLGNVGTGKCICCFSIILKESTNTPK